MIITSHMQKLIQIHPCLLKLSRKQESVTDGRYYYIPHRFRRGIIKAQISYLVCMMKHVFGIIFIITLIIKRLESQINLKIFWNKKNKVPKQESQSQTLLPMSDLINYII
jgi:hypothetical protein